MNQAVPTEIIERVEIIKGPASATYGANATGGVINIITKTGTDDLQARSGSAAARPPPTGPAPWARGK